MIAIPKLIMQTWKTKDVPDKWAESPRSIKEHMPDWGYILMTDEDNRQFVERHFPDFLSYYDGFKYNIQRADAIRYMWLYMNGGIYIDLDTKLNKSLEPLFEGSPGSGIFLVGTRNVSRKLTNMFMASVPGHPVWLACIEEMKKPSKWWMISTSEVLMTTGPLMLTKVVEDYNFSYNRLPFNVLGTNNNHCFSKPDPNAYITPLEGSSWINSTTDKIHKMCYCYSNGLILLGIIAVVILFIVICVYIGYRLK